MNSKKKITAWGLTVFFFLMQHLAFAQTFQYLENKQKFQLSLPVIATSQINPEPYYTVFIETGNGRYIKNNLSIGGATSTSTPYSYPYAIPAGSTAVVTISSYYDETPRPPRNIAVAVRNLYPTESVLPAQINLPFTYGKPQQRIKIDPCVNTIVPGDTMVVAITYKPVSATGTNNIVAFYYNKPNNNIFNSLNSGTDYEFNNPERTKAIRKHHGESISSGGTPSGLPLSVKEELDNAKGDYSNALYFHIPPGADETEKNIFLSLAPINNDQSYTGNTTSFKATIIHYNASGSIVSPENTTYELGINLQSRDPNGIKTSPDCLVIGEDFLAEYNKIIPHKISFENNGAGDAKDIVVRVTVPYGIEFPNTLSAYRLNSKGLPIIFKPIALGGRNYYQLKLNTREIIFTMKGIGLPGTAKQKNITLRQGSISFVLKTVRFDSGITIPDCMFSDVYIKFYNTDSTANPDVTASDSIKRVCGSPQCVREMKVIYPGGDPRKH